jgi:nucleoid-associated protein YgaU
MGFGNLFKLAKLTIVGYKNPKRQGPPFGKFEAQYNPETLSIQHESVFQSQPGVGPTAPESGFSHSRPQRLSVDLVLDGTKVGYMGAERLRHVPTVAEQISKFLSICYFIHGKTHEPSFLKLTWGHGVLGPSFNCRLESVQINYTAFERDGSPLRANLTAVFVEHLDRQKKMAQAGLSSPDLTHRHVVVNGDTLPLLCREIYGSPSHYLQVAQVNGLDDFRNLTPGQELIFPPFDRARKS